MVALLYVVNGIKSFAIDAEIGKSVRGGAVALVYMAGACFVVWTYAEAFCATAIGGYFCGKLIKEKLATVVGSVPKELFYIVEITIH